jgi:hypothetical protein
MAGQIPGNKYKCLNQSSGSWWSRRPLCKMFRNEKDQDIYWCVFIGATAAGKSIRAVADCMRTWENSGYKKG